MNATHACASEPQHSQPDNGLTPAQSELRSRILSASHLLPSQGPISVFVHHNTLHSFEDLPFEQAVLAGGGVYHCEAYLGELRYRAELQSGRIQSDDIEVALREDLGEGAEIFVGSFGTRYALRLAMMEHPIRMAPDVELEWLIAETDAQNRFRHEVPLGQRQEMITQTRHWLRTCGGTELGGHSRSAEMVESIMSDLAGRRMESWTDRQWESFTLRFLWKVCHEGVRQAYRQPEPVSPDRESVSTSVGGVRHRDLLMRLTGKDSDRLVDDILIRFCAAFLDQGFADWDLPAREQGFLPSFAGLYTCAFTPLPPWMRGVRGELQAILDRRLHPLELIAESLADLGVRDDEQESYLLATMLALRGWVGLIWQMETSAPWTPRPAPSGTLEGYLAVRLLLERHALAAVAQEDLPAMPLSVLRQEIDKRLAVHQLPSVTQQAFIAFQLAQVRGWCPDELVNLSVLQWQQLLKEIDAFPSVERRRIFHLAYERRYRNLALDSFLSHVRLLNETQSDTPQLAAYQVVCCIDDREESFRRHLEECDPECETIGTAGFFAVAMYYQGATDAHYRPLCPIVITPQHYVREEPVFSATVVGQQRTQRRKLVGRMTHQVHARSRTLWGGVLTSVLGSLATFPLVARVLAPRLTARLRSTFGSWVRPPATELHIERLAPQPGPEFDALGYSLDEMANIVARVLQDIGLVKTMAPIVVFMGHGSSSMNNPHESAYNCGACSGGRGGPNARAFALMANDARVRQLVAQSGIVIPVDVRFVGAYHNTCNDAVEYYDLDQLPRSHRELFRRIETSVDEARARNAHERSRRFESAELSMSTVEALQHVEERAEDLSQARPEYNHATNALCIVGRRHWSRGLYLDRRAFLVSYDPQIEDDQASILTRILSAALPVCAGISLEYLFSTVDNEGYGAGSKLPHNIASLAGVMTGTASDIRPGLSAQMVEIHEPVRILFIIETSVEHMNRIMDSVPIIGRLVRNNWVQLAIFDSQRNEMKRFVAGQFVPYEAENAVLPCVERSYDWYQERRHHLGFASISASIGKASRATTSAGKASETDLERDTTETRRLAEQLPATLSAGERRSC